MKEKMEKLKEKFSKKFSIAKDFFSSPSLPRTFTLLGILIIILAVPVTVTFLGQQTNTQQHAMVTGGGGQTCTGNIGTPYCCGGNQCQKYYTNAANCSTGIKTVAMNVCECQPVTTRKGCQSGTHNYCTITYAQCHTTYSNCIANSPTCGYVAPTPFPKCSTGSCILSKYCTSPDKIGKTTSGGTACDVGDVCCIFPTPTKTPTCAAPAACAPVAVCNFEHGTGSGTCTTGSGAPGTCCTVPTAQVVANTGVVCQAIPNGETKEVSGTCFVNSSSSSTSGVVCPGNTTSSSSSYVYGYSDTVRDVITASNGSGSSCARINAATNNKYGAYIGKAVECCLPLNAVLTAAPTAPPVPPKITCESTGKTLGTCYIDTCPAGFPAMAKLLKACPQTGSSSHGYICCNTSISTSPTPSKPAPTGSGGGGGGGGGSPTATPIPCQNGLTSQMALNLKLEGIGTGSLENNAPAHTTRQAIYVKVADQNSTIAYDNTATTFTYTNGTFNSPNVSLGTALSCGHTYTVTVKIPRYLPVRATVAYGKSQTLTLDPIAGDINLVNSSNVITGDDKIDINDYALFRDTACGKDVDPTKIIPFTSGSTTVNVKCSDLINFFDFADGGTNTIDTTVNPTAGLDEWSENYNLWTRGYFKANGF